MIRRTFFAAVLLGSSTLAAPPLTTIQDVLYKADGTRFSGTLNIGWTSFQAIDSSTVTSQTTTVRVVNGSLYVQLVPTTASSPPAYYSVTYNSDGRIQFQETWAVPVSSQPLRVRDVRSFIPNTSDQPAANDTIGGATPGGPVQESDVVGLVADLGARPVKGPGFAAGRVALVNAAGLIESATGSPTDCVRVDGSSGPCGPQPPSFVDGDSPAGIVDGANTLFVLSSVPNPVSSLSLYRNGVLQKVGQDYSANGNTVQFVSAATPLPGDTLLASYRLSGTETNPAAPYTAPEILCSGSGASTNAATLTSIGSCTIPAGLLAAGDRVEIRFDYGHVGSNSSFTFEVDWGGTVLIHNDCAALETLVSGRADAAILASGAQVSSQFWGVVLPLSSAVVIANDNYAAGITVKFQGKLAQTGDSLALRSYSVVRLP